MGFGRPFTLLLVVAAPLALAVWLLVSPGVMFSGEMTWDLLFNLEGAWSLYKGQTAHVDFHDPVGILPFAATTFGFYLVGIEPRAFLVGIVGLAAVVVGAACYPVSRRLPLLPSAVALLFLALIILLPVNTGDRPTEFSFAMSYNKFLWSALTLLLIVLFVPPRDARGEFADVLLAALITLALFYTKITYFAVAAVALLVAPAIAGHLEARAYRWLSAFGVVALIAAMPVNFPYWRDLWQAVDAGAVRGSLLSYFYLLLLNKWEYAVFLVQALCLSWLSVRGQVSRTIMAAAFIGAAGFFLVSQNSQNGDIPLYAVLSFMIYAAVARRYGRHVVADLRGPALILAAALLMPGLWSLAMFGSLAKYHLVASDAALATAPAPPPRADSSGSSCRASAAAKPHWRRRAPRGHPTSPPSSNI